MISLKPKNVYCLDVVLIPAPRLPRIIQKHVKIRLSIRIELSDFKFPINFPRYVTLIEE